MKRNLSKPVFILISLFSFLYSGFLFAHPGHIENEISGGFFHVFTGIDHMLALALFGILLAQQTIKSAVLAFCAAFICLFLGYALGAIIGEFSIMELLITATIPLLALVFFKTRQNLLLVSPLFLVHGYAHGVETILTQQYVYVSGLVLGSACVLAIAYCAAQLFLVAKINYASNK